MAGRTLLHYRVLEKIGAGGMGEVYRVLDTKLNRDVAIKLLPEAFAGSPERVARLRREAQLLAALNHPNIAAVYDLEEADGQWFLVLELVPGKTLAEQLHNGPLPLRQATAVCRQIAEALEAAHEKGIIHRDLKPANVKITPDGHVKLLDFGLAKVNPVSAGSQDQTSAETRAEFTQPGLLLGTIAYMSPEQARGEPVDRRSDIWAFGCVLYEALTGRRLFAGKTASDTMAEILRGDPTLEGLPATTPPSVRILLERCLRHDRARRLRDIGDARLELEDERAAAPPAPPRRASRGAVWMLAGTLLAAIALGAAWWQMQPRRESASNVQFQRLTDSLGMEESPAISPDGKAVAFVAPTGGRRHIWVRLLAGGIPLQITRDDADHQQPRWAPDSSSLIYYSPAGTPGEQGTIREVSALGGAPRRVAAASSGGDISHDGRRIALFREQGGHTELAVVTRDGSSVNVVKQLSGDALYDSPRWSPDNHAIAYQRLSHVGFDARVYIVAASGGGAATSRARRQCARHRVAAGLVRPHRQLLAGEHAALPTDPQPAHGGPRWHRGTAAHLR